MLKINLLVFLAAMQLTAVNWSAKWISVPDASPYEFGVYHFRRTFDLGAKPETFVVQVTGDNRYQLFVNGTRVCEGPARGDLKHWRYETVDIAPHLKAGRNVLAAVVWNFAQYAPVAQETDRTGFLLQGERSVETGKSWKCIRNPAYAPIDTKVPGYWAAGPGERVDAARYPWGWERPEFSDAAWVAAAEGRAGTAREGRDAPTKWMLVPRSIPMMEEKPEPLKHVRRGPNVPLEVPARQQVSVLLDQDYLTTAYPELTLSGGKGATVKVTYAEAMYPKGNRNEIEGKQIVGQYDVFLPDGGAQRVFRPLWWRTWRYLQLDIETGADALKVEGIRGIYTAYPFQVKARFEADIPDLQKILDTGFRTARLCAHESYMDCPYWEQLQYVGDTRIQALISMYYTGDARLVKNAIEQIDSSRTPEGATYSRAPSNLQQYIPPFSLWWIGMVHDYWMYQDDAPFVKQMLPGVRAVISFFAAHQKANGGLGAMPWWNYIDWTRQWKGGTPPNAAGGGSPEYDLQLLMAYQWAAELEAAFGSKGLANDYKLAAAQLRSTIRSSYWDGKLFGNSQHANALAVLAGVSSGTEARELMARVATDDKLVQCSIYFRYYLHAAMTKAGLGDRYVGMLGPWREMLSKGLTTWAEQADPTRSDCHAWGASPNFELFRTVLGIDTAAPGFKRVTVKPNLGDLQRASGAIPHPKGEVAVRVERKGKGLTGEIVLPAETTGSLVWEGQTVPLKSGTNPISVTLSASKASAGKKN